MSSKTLFMDQALYDYMRSQSLREPPLLAELRAETANLEMAVMQITPEQGQFMTLIARLIGARRVIEVGTFTGYSALALALGLPEDGYLLACDISAEWTAIGRPYWQQAEQAGKIDLKLAPALETLDDLLKEGQAGTYDLAFIDADKENYHLYYERCLQLLRPGGLIMVDNVFWGGSVADEANQKPETVAIREFNRSLFGDERVHISMLPIGDGLTLAQKR